MQSKRVEPNDGAAQRKNDAACMICTVHRSNYYPLHLSVFIFTQNILPYFFQRQQQIELSSFESNL